MSRRSNATDPDWMWNVHPPAEQGRNEDALFRLRRARRVPTQAAMLKGGPEALLEGLLPDAPLISPETRVIAIGSCFAALFAQWLAESGFNTAFDPSGDESLLRLPLETPVSVAQQFRWAFGELDPALAVWYRERGERFEASEDARLALQRTLCASEVIVITLGLSEAWYDMRSGEPVWRIPPVAGDEARRFEHRVVTVDETVEALETVARLRVEHMPFTRIVYTVSPVRFRATFRPMSAIVANSASKAIVRAAVDEFLRRHEDELGSVYFYFPSYEIVRDYFRDPFLPDNRHLDKAYSDVVIDVFARYFTTLTATSLPPVEAFDEHPPDLLAELTAVEQKNVELQEICDERLAVIEELKSACEERLALIERLNAELAARSSV